MRSPQLRPSSKPTGQPPPTDKPCIHPRIEIVARDRDSEFVECKECGEVFEASEFKDMAAEERLKNDEA